MTTLRAKPSLTRRYGSGLRYYARSVAVLAAGLRHRGALLGLGLRRWPASLEFRDGSRLMVRSLLDAWIAKETILDDVYELSQLQASWNVVDIGAGIGEFTVAAARRVGPGSVHAYEPAPGSAALLRRNVEYNELTNVRVFEEAVTSSPGEVALRDEFREAAMYQVSDPTDAAAGAKTVTAVDLEQVIARLPRQRCDFLKLDCEGAEFGILFAADPAVLRSVGKISLEYHDFSPATNHRELAAYLEAAGRSVVVTKSPVYDELGYMYSNSSRSGQ